MFEDCRVYLSNSLADDFRIIRNKFPALSDSELVNEMINALYEQFYIQHIKIPKANIEKTNSQPIRTRIRYSYKSYHRVQRFKQDFKKTDAKLIRALLPLYRMKVMGGFKN